MLLIVHYALFLGVAHSLCRFYVAARINRGWYGVTGEYPYVVSIQEGSTNRQICGGSILSSMFVLTACECFKIFKANGKYDHYDDNDMLVIAGGSDRIHDMRRQIRAPDLIFVHPFCDDVGQGEIIYNVAAVKVNSPFYWNSFVMPANFILSNIQLDQKKNQTKGYYNKCFGAGWGGIATRKWRDYKKSSSMLKVTEIILWERKACTKWLCARNSFYCTTTEYFLLCGIGPNNDGCIGDSGGPLICDDFVLGIISWGPACAEREEPAVIENFKYIYDFVQPVLDNIQHEHI